MKIRKVIFISIFFSIMCPLCAGIMARPRRVSLLKTEHFDILYSEPSSNTASFLADNIDNLYNKAKSHFPDVEDFRIPVVISPDSDKLSVKYTSSPYNRIVFFDGVPENIDNVFSNTILGFFYHEIYLAISQSVRSPVNQFISKFIGGDSYQPVSTFYLPFSFVEARAFIAESEDGYGRFNDSEFLEILSLAKFYDMFPNWIQATTSMDIYPGKILNMAASTGFAAYLIFTYGVDKYVELWERCGEVNFNLTAGMFYKVYNVKLKDLWKGFEDSVPLPASMEDIEKFNEIAKELFPHQKESLFQNVIMTDYGLVWYDGIRNEVDIFDWNSPFKIPQLLFLASDVKKLSLSNDGRYLIVSFYGINSKSQFRDDKSWIYDLQKREKLKYSFPLRDGELVELENGKKAIAGINVKDKVSKFQVYELNYDKKTSSLYMEKEFPIFEYPFSVTYAGKNKVNYLVTKNNTRLFNQLNFENNEERSWNIFYRNNPVKIKNLRALPPSKFGKNHGEKELFYVFEYYADDEPCFSRFGVIKVNKDYLPTDVYFMNKDVPGGVHYPYVYDDVLLYVADRYDHSDLLTVPINALSFEKGAIIEVSSGDVVDSAVASGDGETWAVVVTNSATGAAGNAKTGETVEPEETEEPEETVEPKETVKLEETEEPEETVKPNAVSAASGVESFGAEVTNNVKEASGNGEKYTVGKYNPVKYMINCSVKPFMAIKNLSTNNVQHLWPSLGGTVITQDDPFLNNKIIVSAGAAYAPLDFMKIVNPSEDDIVEKEKIHVDDKKNISAAISIENSSTPVDIIGGCIFKANKQGEYIFTAAARGLWSFSLGMAFSKINLNLNLLYTASTDYYDLRKAATFPSLNNWPSFYNAYQYGIISFGVEYTNIHQCGFSKYEKRGFSVGARLDTFWDITELIMLQKNADKIESQQNSNLTPAQRAQLYEKSRFDISQLNIGFFGNIEIPRLTPFRMYKGLVLSVPASVKAEFLTKPGTALSVNTEALLLGYELQNGFSPLYIYFSRLGIKAGYNFDLRYRTEKVQLPDIRRKNNLWNVFSNTYIRDSFFIMADMNFCLSIGKLSEYHINLAFKFEYFIRTHGYRYGLNFTVSL